MASLVRGYLGRQLPPCYRLALALLFAAALLVACSDATTPSTSVLIARPAENQWPDAFWQASPDVQEAYRFAVTNPRVLEFMPCYCGCGNQDHISNKDCFIDEFRPDGSVVLDPMGFG